MLYVTSLINTREVHINPKADRSTQSCKLTFSLGDVALSKVSLSAANFAFWFLIKLSRYFPRNQTNHLFLEDIIY